MFEVLCKNRGVEPAEGEAFDLSFSAVSQIFSETAKPGLAVKVKRAAWQASLAQLMTRGVCRRAHFKVLISAEVLRYVGFSAKELHKLGYSPKELRVGLFAARELSELGCSPAELKRLGYAPRDLHDAQVRAKVMRELKYTAKQLHGGGYTAQEMKDSHSYSLVELKEAQYKAAELGEAGYIITELRAARFTALELRRAGGIYTVSDLTAVLRLWLCSCGLCVTHARPLHLPTSCSPCALHRAPPPVRDAAPSIR